MSNSEQPLVTVHDQEKLSKGCICIGAVRGTRVYLHWSLPLGGLYLSILMGFKLHLAPWLSIGLILLILVHELGHVCGANMLGKRIFTLQLAGWGGHCTVQRPKAVADTLILYSGGLAAQVLLFAGTFVTTFLFGFPETDFGLCIFYIFTAGNVVLALMCLYPYLPASGLPSDGYILWKLLQHVRKKGPHPFPDFWSTSHVFSPGTELLNMAGLTPDDFACGVQILNDETTPMEFVILMLTKHLGMARDEAIDRMLQVHTRGGMLLPVATMALAEKIAADISAEVRAAGHALDCRAVQRATMAA